MMFDDIRLNHILRLSFNVNWNGIVVGSLIVRVLFLLFHNCIRKDLHNAVVMINPEIHNQAKIVRHTNKNRKELTTNT